jgi:hypothetical protein
MCFTYKTKTVFGKLYKKNFCFRSKNKIDYIQKFIPTTFTNLIYSQVAIPPNIIWNKKIHTELYASNRHPKD